MGNKKKDFELIEEIRNGKPHLFNQLVSTYLPLVLSFLQARGGDAHTCEDVAQETFLKVHQNLSKFSFGAPFVSWLLTIARNQLVDHFRKIQRETRVIREASALSVERESAPDDSDSMDISVFLQKLSPEDRTIIELRVFQELSFQEIGELLEIREGTLRVRFHRIMAGLREKIGMGEQE